jgi:hypothetical protein
MLNSPEVIIELITQSKDSISQGNYGEWVSHIRTFRGMIKREAQNGYQGRT